MALAAGTRLGPYEILASLGAGGMGEVYRARDARLGRDVAIKSMPAAFAPDPERLARFEREAKLLAALNHPNVGAIYGLEEAAGHRYLVLELVEGETLAARLQRGALPLVEALDVCRQVAAALESAHENGIVHRDLKPANVMLTAAGGVKVLDFGLAKGESAGSSSDVALSASPTMSYDVTNPGMILGTAAYMSPEQARGKTVDKRTDIWSFGCVLYESLTGHQCFEGETVSDLIAHILQTEPAWDALPPRTPARTRDLLRRCLEKDARRRLRDIGDARIEIEETLALQASGASMIGVSAGVDRGVRRLGLGAGRLVSYVLVGLAAVAATMMGMSISRHESGDSVRFEVSDAAGMKLSTDGANSALSPDGAMLAFVAGDSGNTRLWIRTLGTLAARPIAGSEGAQMPFWSPDSRHVAFFTETKLERVDAAGADVEELCQVKRARGGSWNRNDVIVFAPRSEGGIYRIPAGGGEPQPVTSVDSTRHESGHRFPCFLPDGRHFLFSVLPPTDGKFEIDVGSIDSPAREKLLTAASGALYAPPGLLLTARGNHLVVQRFDGASRRLKGDPITLHENLAGTGFSGGAGFTVSASGRLAYQTFVAPDTRMAWCDTHAREIRSVPLPRGPYNGIALSPDGKRVALTRTESVTEQSIWIGDLERGIATRFSQESASCESPVWSPDGRRIAYLVSQLGPQSVVVRSVDGGQPVETALGSDPAFKQLSGWSPDGRYLLYSRQDPVSRWDLWLLPTTGDRTPRPYLSTPFSEQQMAISKDGRWAAYRSDESGRPEMYVQSFPVPGSKYQVTSGGGVGGGFPKWAPEFLFAEASMPNTIRAAAILPGPVFRLGPAQTFATLPAGMVGLDIGPAKDRVITLMPAAAQTPNSITVVIGWPTALVTPR